MLLENLKKCRVVPVVTIDNADHAVPLCRALAKGGLNVAEFTFRTKAAPDAIRLATEALPEFLVGAGTLLTPESVDAAKHAGAQFGVAPGLNPRVVERASEIDFPFFPGVCTPSDVESAIELGCTTLKFFPAEAAGGIAMLSALYAPYAHLGIWFMPTGGIKLDNVKDYLDHPSVIAAGGTWIAPSDLIREENWNEISARAAAVNDLVAQRRNA